MMGTVVVSHSATEVTYTAVGTGAPVLLLHGGGGPATVSGFAERYAATRDAQVIVPVHPGFDGTARPSQLTSIAGLAQLYVQLLDDLGLADVTVVGNSIGGWLAAEMALLHSPRAARYVVVDGVGLVVDGAPIADFFSLTMDQVVDLSYARPDDFRVDVDTLPEQARTAMAGNREALRVYGGTSMADPSLAARLPDAAGPTLVVWGRADRIVPVEHGHAYAEAMPEARLHVVEDAGHLPQIETPDTFGDLLTKFITEH